MKGDKIYPKNCITGMPKLWKWMLYIVDVWFMSKEVHKRLFETTNVELMARDKKTGYFVTTPLLFDEHYEREGTIK